MKARARAELALAGVTVIWGSTFVLVKSALADISTFLFLTLRFTVAAVVLFAIYRAALNRKGFGPGIFAGCLLFTAYVFQTLGLELTTPSKSAFITGLSIPMVPLASSLVYRVRPRPFEIAGILVASFGMALMTLPSGSTSFNISRGDLLSFLCAIVFALHIVVLSHYSPTVGFQTIAVLQVAAAAVLGAGSVLIGGSLPFQAPIRFHATTEVVAAVLITGLLATALAFTTMAWAQKYTTATRSALIFTLEPVVAWITSWVLTGETLPMRAAAGGGMILAGILLVELRFGNAGNETNGAQAAS
jgi:drug/metabolite transporter (DMT)-like permease